MGLEVKKVSFGGAKIKGDYSQVQKKARNAGYPLKYVIKIHERLKHLFPHKGDTLKFVDGYVDVFDGCCSTYKSPLRKVKLIRNHREIDVETVQMFKKPVVHWLFQNSVDMRLGLKHAKKYAQELQMLEQRQYLLAFFQAAVRLAKRIPKP